MNKAQSANQNKRLNYDVQSTCELLIIEILQNLFRLNHAELYLYLLYQQNSFTFTQNIFPHHIAASNLSYKMFARRKLTSSMKNKQFSMFSLIESQTVVITGDYGTPQDREPFA